ncbi:MAG: helix-turn-helix domain-containing protein [Anaerolineales bacterium]|nr:helix-turn-helix domain-containing protein [Anaerolineales bacterium]
MSDEYVTIEEAARRSGLHIHTVRRLLVQGVLFGYKASVGGRRRWLISTRSLRHYCDPINGFLLDLRGPKLYLRRLADSQDDGD